MKKILLILALFILAAGILISCKKELPCEGCRENNKRPIVLAGPDKVITLPTDSILLDGSASNDPDGTIREWLWKKIEGPASFNIVNTTTAKTIVRNLDTGIYKFELKVTDDKGLFAKDTMQVIVDDVVTTNHLPGAQAGYDQTISLPINTVMLDGSGSADPDNNITAYAWTKISGPSSFNIVNANVVQTQVVNLVIGVYQFELKVTDAGGLFSKDTMQVQVNASSGNQPACLVSNPPEIQGTLTQIGTLSVPRMPTAGTAGNKVVFAGGWAGINCQNGSGWFPSSTSSAVDIYDIQTNSWSNAQLSIARAGMRSATIGNKIFFAGGENGVSTVYDNVDVYDISTNTWTTGHLSLPRAYVATAAIGNKVFFAGGYYYTGTSTPGTPNGTSNIVDIYDVSTNQWSVATLSGIATGIYTATAVNGKVYFAGGSNDGIINIYDNNANTWSTSSLQFQWQPIGYPIFHNNPFTSFAVGNNIYWAGNVYEGSIAVGTDDFSVYTGRAEVRNTLNGTTSISCFPLISSQQPVFRNNEIAFFSSFHRQFWNQWGVTNSFPIYNTITGTWSTVNAVNANSGLYSLYTMSHDAGIVSANNTIYVGGGSYPGTCVLLFDKVYTLSW